MRIWFINIQVFITFSFPAHHEREVMSDSEILHPFRDRAISYQSDMNTDVEIEPLAPIDDLNTSMQDLAVESLLRASQRRKKYKKQKSPELDLSDVTIQRPEPIRWKIQPSNTSSSYSDSSLPSCQGYGRDSERNTSEDNEERIVSSFNRSSNARQNVKIPPKSTQEINTVMTSTHEDLKRVELSNRGGPSAFTPVVQAGKKVNFAKQRQKRRKDVIDLPARIMEPGAVDLTKYSLTANLWLEQVDRRTVEKSKSVYMAVMREGDDLPERIRRKREVQTDSATPAHWVIARGRSLRRAKQLTSMSSIPRSPVSDVEYAYGERPMSPGRQVILFFKVGSKWRDLAWVLFEGLLSESETIRVIKDIELKNPTQHNAQIQDLLDRWWHRKGMEATIDELKTALDLVTMPYIVDEAFGEKRFSDAESDVEYSGILDISEIDDNDPNVSRYIEEYDYRSMNNSFDLNISTGNHMRNTSLSAENITQRLVQTGITPVHQSASSSAIDSTSLPHSSSSLLGQPGAAHHYSATPLSVRTHSHSVDTGLYNQHLDTSRISNQPPAFVITQPQLERVDVSQP